MTVSSTTSRVSYSGDDSTVSFPIPFNFMANADIVAVLADADGDETTWTITTDYTLTGAGGTSGGTLTAVAAPATGETLVIYRDPEIRQLVDYVDNDPFPADTHEGALDKLTYICQALDEKVGRALLQPVTSSSSNVTFATPAAGKVLLWNATGTAVTNGPDADEITNAQGYATAAADSAADAAAAAATVPTFPSITGEGDKYVKINAGGTAIEYDALGTAAQADLASQAEAEAGTDNTKCMTPLRVSQAIAALVEPTAGGLTGMQVFTANGTFTVPDGVTAARVICVGGGGGSGGGTIGTSSGSGGGGGYSEKIITGLTPESTVTVTVGAGGTAGTSTADGGTGGTSSFGSHVTAPGGEGGTKSLPTSGAGGNPTTSGALNIPGESGLHSVFTIGTTQVENVRGGRSFLCQSLLTFGYLGLYSSSTPAAGVGIGCGATGGRNTGGAFNGAAGANGVVIIQY